MAANTGGFRRTEGWTKLDATFQSALAQLEASCGVKTFSGYRSDERQEVLWAQALSKYGSEAAARKWVAKPAALGGKGSNHSRGIAADLDGSDSQFACAQANAARFGLRFPMSWEPWHVELASAEPNPDAYTTPPGKNIPVDTTDPLSRLASNLHTIFGQGEQVRDISDVDLSRPEELAAQTQAGAGASATGGTGTGAGDDPLARFMTAIKAVESGGRVYGQQDYKAVGLSTPYGQATGAYQWLDSTWNNYKGYRRAMDAPPAVQEERARRDMQSMYAKYGDWRQVAMAWYGGPDQSQWGPRTQRYATDVLSLYGGA